MSPDPHANVPALVTSISPIKQSKYFDGELTDGDSMIRFVGFDKKQRRQLLPFCEKGIPINCQITLNKYNSRLEVVMKTHTKVEQSDVKFNISDPKTLGSPIINLNELDTLKEYDRATVKVTALKISDPQTVSTGKIKKCTSSRFNW